MTQSVGVFGVPAEVSGRVYRHPLFCIGCATFYSSPVSIRAEISESDGESATAAQCGLLPNLRGGRPEWRRDAKRRVHFLASNF